MNPKNEHPTESVPPEERMTRRSGRKAAAKSTDNDQDSSMHKRYERLGGEPAPAISPEQFSKLVDEGQVHIDHRGRVRSARSSNREEGMSLRKRRAWYAAA